MSWKLLLGVSGAPLAMERSGLSGKDLLVAWPLRERTGIRLSCGVGGEEDMMMRERKKERCYFISVADIV